MKNFFHRWLLMLPMTLCVSAVEAQVLTVTQFGLPTSSYFYSTNMFGGTGATVKVSADHLGGPTGNGGQPATNAIPANSTNSAVWQAPIDLSWFQNGSLLITETTLTNIWTTNWIFLYPCPDGVNSDTNHPVVLGPFTNNVFGTNLLDFTNLVINNGPMGAGGPRYWTAGWGVQGTNTVTNAYLQIFSTRLVTRIEQP